MASEMLLINPRRRRRASTTAKRRRRTTRASNPVRHHRRRARRRNPISMGSIRRRFSRGARRTVSRRRRNPISLGSSAAWMTMLKNAAIGGAGAIAIDALMGQLNNYLPVSMKRTPGTLGVGDAVKAAITVLAGVVLNKTTRGLSVKMAQGALTVQAADVLRTFVPATMTMGGMGYGNPGLVMPGQARVGPNAMFQRGGSPLLNGVGMTFPGSALLNGRGSSARQREHGIR